jgi:arylsulfatase A-like enzyme
MGFDQWLSHDNFFEIDPPLSRNGGPPEQFMGESSEILIQETIRFVSQAAQNQRPFFVVVWFGSPHEPYMGLEEDLALYDDLPSEYGERSVTLTSLETGLPTERPLREVLRERYAEITAMDRAIGDLRQYLEESGLRENTLLWYCGDNGVPASGVVDSPLRGRKGQLYEGGIRVPGIIEWPSRIPSPRATEVNGVTSDMLPTICDLLDLPLPERVLDGVSLCPLIVGDMENRPQPVYFWEYNTSGESRGEPYISPALQSGTTPLVKQMDGKFTRSFRNFHHPAITERDFTGARAVLDNRYKLVIHDDSGEVVRELFDLRSDPAESQDLYATQPEIALELERQLREWQQSVLESLTGFDYR